MRNNLLILVFSFLSFACAPKNSPDKSKKTKAEQAGDSVQPSSDSVDENICKYPMDFYSQPNWQQVFTEDQDQVKILDWQELPIRFKVDFWQQLESQRDHKYLGSLNKIPMAYITSLQNTSFRVLPEQRDNNCVRPLVVEISNELYKFTNIEKIYLVDSVRTKKFFQPMHLAVNSNSEFVYYISSSEIESNPLSLYLGLYKELLSKEEIKKQSRKRFGFVYYHAVCSNFSLDRNSEKCSKSSHGHIGITESNQTLLASFVLRPKNDEALNPLKTVSVNGLVSMHKALWLGPVQNTKFNKDALAPISYYFEMHNVVPRYANPAFSDALKSSVNFDPSQESLAWVFLGTQEEDTYDVWGMYYNKKTQGQNMFSGKRKLKNK